MFRFITNRPLWVNFLVAIGGLIILILVFLLSLNWITRHGEMNAVPSLLGKNVNDAEKVLEDLDFDIVIQDSVYYDSLPPGVVIRQVPDPDDVVKVNRTVYVTINRFVPPDIDMPNLVGSSFRNAEMTLRNLGLRLGDTSYRFDFAKNSVLEQIHNGNIIAAGTSIKVGSAISLVLGSGLGVEDQPVPDLRGMTFEEAKVMADAQGISIGARLFDPGIRDSANAYIYRQSPLPRTEDGARVRIRAGQMIDIWLSFDLPNLDSIRKGEQTPLP
jgi:eukaryotic-like serine/threonine-protein kinase